MSYKSNKVKWCNYSSEIRSIREQVFIYEYRFSEEQEFDGDDNESEHILVRDPTGKAIATGRLSRDGKISRVAVLMQYRKKEVGKTVINGLLNIAKERGLKKVYFDSLLDEVRKYRNQGFIPIGSVYMEAGIAKQPLMCDIELFKISTTILH
ncbi:GNAT family N-acetyltransferase [Psychrosphaera ytuae]|uniref:GNAT family N-acetyltransferase n=1 Tax=Psychrosphaera ytuae TaxID=2820710 RepID=A0A975DBV2_9GAMM|nr:GNAT family N-acetyltransferase [Psychrosphaera ytuae]QTH64084.1 GNAT family N-acetyltransferase [Psychrosphaera ytuae]